MPDSQLKLLIAIPTCHRYDYFDASTSPHALHKNGNVGGRNLAVRATWYKTWREGVYCQEGTPAYPNCPYSDLIDMTFFYGLPDTLSTLELEPDSVTLESPDDYRHLPYKVKEMFRYALDHGYDYVLKVDDDTFVWLDRLLDRFLPTDYLGYVSGIPDTGDVTGLYASGAAYWISAKAMQFVVDAEWNPEEWAEDKWVGKVLAENGILPVHDERMRVCHCDLCVTPYSETSTTQHLGPNIGMMKELYDASAKTST